MYLTFIHSAHLIPCWKMRRYTFNILYIFTISQEVTPSPLRVNTAIYRGNPAEAAFTRWLPPFPLPLKGSPPISNLKAKRQKKKMETRRNQKLEAKRPQCAQLPDLCLSRPLLTICFPYVLILSLVFTCIAFIFEIKILPDLPSEQEKLLDHEQDVSLIVQSSALVFFFFVTIITITIIITISLIVQSSAVVIFFSRLFRSLLQYRYQMQYTCQSWPAIDFLSFNLFFYRLLQRDQHFD